MQFLLLMPIFIIKAHKSVIYPPSLGWSHFSTMKIKKNPSTKKKEEITIETIETQKKLFRLYVQANNNRTKL